MKKIFLLTALVASFFSHAQNVTLTKGYGNFTVDGKKCALNSIVMFVNPNDTSKVELDWLNHNNALGKNDVFISMRNRSSYINGTTGLSFASVGALTAFYDTFMVGGTSSGGGAGTVTSVSSGSLSPIFTSSVTTSTSTPAIAYTLSSAGARTVLCNTTNGSAAPAYSKIDLPNMVFGTLGTANGGTGTTLTTSVNGTPVAYGTNNTLSVGTTVSTTTVTVSGNSGTIDFDLGISATALIGACYTDGTAYAYTGGDLRFLIAWVAGGTIHVHLETSSTLPLQVGEQVMIFLSYK